MSTKKKRPVYEEEEEATVNVADVVKGIIAVMITALVVIIVIMMFAKSLFSSDNTEERKTGRLTAAPNYSTTTTTTAAIVTETKKATTTKDGDADPYQTKLAAEGATEMTVKDGVWLHPEPSSKSTNIVVIPKGTKVTAYAIVNGAWLYVDYNGQLGYAFADYFDGTRPSATTVPS
ncbi:MAG: SH3 domain-containing protein [Ruminococcus sp.]|nr:SH3 domain-containing protein [Ruminococcus sp.]